MVLDLFWAMVDSVSVRLKNASVSKKMSLNIRIQWNAETACVSECVLKTLACRGLRVGPSKVWTYVSEQFISKRSRQKFTRTFWKSSCERHLWGISGFWVGFWASLSLSSGEEKRRWGFWTPKPLLQKMGIRASVWGPGNPNAKLRIRPSAASSNQTLGPSSVLRPTLANC